MTTENSAERDLESAALSKEEEEQLLVEGADKESHNNNNTNKHTSKRRMMDSSSSSSLSQYNKKKEDNQEGQVSIPTTGTTTTTTTSEAPPIISTAAAAAALPQQQQQERKEGGGVVVSFVNNNNNNSNETTEDTSEDLPITQSTASATTMAMQRTKSGSLRRPPKGRAEKDTDTKRRNDNNEDDSLFARKVAVSETRFVNLLRLVLFVVLISVTILVSVAVYTVTEHDQDQRFESHVEVHQDKIMETFSAAVSDRLQSMNAMATAMTSHALSTQQQFPFVTLPHFELRGSALRVQAQTHAMHYAPLVRNDTVRAQWEQYALEQRSQIDVAFASDRKHRLLQDEALGYTTNDDDTTSTNGNNNQRRRTQQQQQQQSQQQQQQRPDDNVVNETILGDGTGFHPSIWSNGAKHPRGDEAADVGPYFPAWQRSPVNGARQKFLNLNFASTKILDGVVEGLLQGEAVIQRVVLPLPIGMEQLVGNMAISQYRHEEFETYVLEPVSFFAYPVLDSFEPDNASVAGVIVANMYWRLLFSQALPDAAGSFVCVLENSFNQTVSYLLNGSNTTFLGEGDHHDTAYDRFGATMDLNEFYMEHLKNAAMRSYTSVPLSMKYGRYILKVYPTSATEEMFATNEPWLYTGIVAAVSIFTSILFIAFVYFVERRQTIVMDRVVQNAEKAAATERDLNEYLAHEIRNPLSSAILAHSFVKTSLSDRRVVPAASDRSSLREDTTIVDSSLQFIDEFLQSMLLMYRAAANKVEVGLLPTNLYEEVFKPVSDILSPQKGSFDVVVECSPGLVVATDPLRLKQVLLNLGRNASKFVVSGFVRLRAAVVGGMVELAVEDSGPGVAPEMREVLFQKYHTSLEVVTQGNGIGLALCKNLVTLLGGSIFLDQSYDSGIPGSPGARFVIRLKQPPIATQLLLDEEQPPDRTIRSSMSNRSSFQSLPPPDGPPPTLPQNFSVLFVDDDSVLRKLFMRSLRKLCPTWRIEGATNGEAALDLVAPIVVGSNDEDTGGGVPNTNAGCGFDLIFLDQYMATTEPRMTGCETVAELRARGVVNVTICGLSANEMEREFLASGADFFELKPLPFERDALEAVLLRLTTTTLNTSPEPAPDLTEVSLRNGHANMTQ